MCRICVATTTESKDPLPEEKELRNQIANDVLRYIYQQINHYENDEIFKKYKPNVDTTLIARLGNGLSHVVVDGFNSMKSEYDVTKKGSNGDIIWPI